MRYVLIILVLIPQVFFAQSDSLPVDDYFNEENIKPTMLPIHPLGIFSMRVANNYREAPISKTALSFGVSNGNIWLPQIDTYKPIDPTVQKQMANTSFFYRQDIFKIDTMAAQKTQFLGDGVLQEYRLEIITAINKKQEVHLGVRAYRLSGKALLSVFTNDRVVEAFHQGMGIHDPFKRSLHQYDSAAIRYVDE